MEGSNAYHMDGVYVDRSISLQSLAFRGRSGKPPRRLRLRCLPRTRIPAGVSRLPFHSNLSEDKMGGSDAYHMDGLYVDRSIQLV
ncbi:hypothetical protein [Peribacillus sp. SI8-4]|uniref:hypothetical protein n=1 Tax=Peribacillus sp. SI8-4 TaxID=3048009 RepID=UPI002554072D|nr:hypothetical protein [Peribacillus sp. SI8-4]